MKSKIAAIPIAAGALSVCLCACARSDAFLTSPTEGRSDPFDYQGNMVKSEVVIDGNNDDELWKSGKKTTVHFAECEVTVMRRPTALYFYFKVFDTTPYAFVGEGAADEVTFSDSIEIYIDRDIHSRYETPQANCYQINLGRDSRTRILSGSGGSWLPWAGMYTFETREGYDDESDYYYMEVMIPVAQLGVGATEDMGIAFGQVDRTVEDNKNLESYYRWFGMTYNDRFIEPQNPSEYLVLRTSDNKILSYAEYMRSKPDATADRS